MSKIVLIGGPSSGKSTLVEMMGNNGFNIISEVAKDIIAKTGIINPQNKAQYAEFQDKIIQEQMKREEQIKEDEITILDRGIYDTLAYSERYLGFVSEKIQRIVNSHETYDRVFLLDRLPFVKADFRIEQDDLEAEGLHERVREIYIRRGHRLENIPVMSKDKRLKYLMEKIS